MKFIPHYFLILILLLIDLSLVHAQQNEEDTPPNIVFILADDLGYGDLSSYGATKISTPNIDRLAKEGKKFTDAYSPHSVCTPTRYALLTGRYGWRTWNEHATLWADDPLLIDTTRVTLPKLLQSEGYKTAVIGKWHLGFGDPNSPNWIDNKGPDWNKKIKPGPIEVGFDYSFVTPFVGQLPHVYVENHRIVGLNPDEEPMRIILDEQWKDRVSYLDRYGVPAHQFEGGGEAAKYEHEDLAITLTDRAVDYIEEQEQEPFFLYFAHRNIHGPLIPNPKFKDTSEIGVYGDFINELDWSVGEILNALDRKGLTKNTIVIFSSDNGGVEDYRPSKFAEINGHKPNGPFFGQKTEVYEGGVRVPLLIRWPGIVEEGSTSKRMIALNDMLATMADFFEVNLPWNAGEDSFSFLSELLGTQIEQQVREEVIVDGAGGLLGIRKGPWKLILGKGGGTSVGSGGDKPQAQTYWDISNRATELIVKGFSSANSDVPPGQLYNLQRDPQEQNNLYKKYPKKVVELRWRLRDIQMSGRSR
ncbi:MAG: sulfatase-like hydrolase/transferase [Bacteroidetes bacterium]|jgi:arylsulfatase A-like enzyme|nr:sulfatase-like hydrolase/transferase [Bacteroidota bacterium]